MQDAKEIIFTNNGVRYKAKQIRENHFSEGLKVYLFMYLISDEEGEVIGCVNLTLSLLINTLWADSGESNLDEESKSKLFLSMLEHLPFDPEKLRELYQNGNYCFEYFLSREDSGLSSDGRTYTIKVSDGLLKTAKDIIFEGKATDKKIINKLLGVLKNHWELSSSTGLLLKDLQVLVPVGEQAVTRVLFYLKDDGLVELILEPADSSKIVSAKITSKGVKFVNDELTEQPGSVEYVNQKIMGDNITASTTGDNSPIIIKSKDIGLAFSEIVKEIEVEQSESKELVLLVKSLEEELKGEKEPKKVVGLLEKIKGEASWVNQKILSHPLLAQLMATILAKSMGL